MANITPVQQTKPDDRTLVFLWEQINQDDEGAAIRVTPAYVDKTVHMIGTFNGSAYTLECSMDNLTWVVARDVQGVEIALSAAAARTVAPNALYWRVSNDNVGTDEDVDVYLICSL